MKATLDGIRECLDGATPAVVATCARDGSPNVTFLSQAQYVDPEHVALSFQFFGKTRQNVLENPRARLLVWHPKTAAMYRLDARYARTETEGPTFERLRASLAGIASHTGMEGVFRLLGADIYRVIDVAPVPGRRTLPDAPRRPKLAGVRATCAAQLEAADLDGLFRETLTSLARHLDVSHAMVLVHDPSRGALYCVASHGYERSGVGAEIPLGAGVIGVAARERVPIRITHVTNDRTYVLAARDPANGGAPHAREIAWPGLAAPGSQVALPLVSAGQLHGVLFAESAVDGRFGYDDEDALAIVASHLATNMVSLGRLPDDDDDAPPAVAPVTGRPTALKHYRADDSVFLDDEYVIKGVAGAILWAMACDHARTGRVCFTNRELRLDPRIPLPALGDNLEARLVLLTRRLAEKGACLRLERVGRGRLRLDVTRPLELSEIG